jgi:hypothetical protein
MLSPANRGTRLENVGSRHIERTNEPKVLHFVTTNNCFLQTNRQQQSQIEIKSTTYKLVDAPSLVQLFGWRRNGNLAT